MFTVVKFCRHRAATCGWEEGKVREGPPCISPPPPCVSTGLSDLSNVPKPSLHELHSAICVTLRAAFSTMVALFIDNAGTAGIVFIMSSCRISKSSCVCQSSRPPLLSLCVNSPFLLGWILQKGDSNSNQNVLTQNNV